MKEDAEFCELLDLTFGVFDRVVFLLGEDFRILWVSSSLDQMACKPACRNTSVCRVCIKPPPSHRAPGSHAAEMLGDNLFGPSGSLRGSLEAGILEEGRRAFLRCCPEGGSRLVSISAARLPKVIGGGRYMIIARPSVNDAVLLERVRTNRGILAESPPMLQIVRLIETLQYSEANVLITGESGVGKEVVARAIHAHSPRSDGPFIAVNCGAIPEALLESELFGHKRGAFTGALQDRQGRFALAWGGTLFLDEIGDMPQALQVKLLRVVQERLFIPLGTNQAQPLSARLISATNVNLPQAIQEGRFREDLYYRLRVVPIHVPPLRERAIEIPALARHFLALIGAKEGLALRFSPEAMGCLRRFHWPGNARQLENAIEYAVALCRGQTIEQHHLPVELQHLLEIQVEPLPALAPTSNMPQMSTPYQAPTHPSPQDLIGCPKKTTDTSVLSTHQSSFRPLRAYPTPQPLPPLSSPTELSASLVETVETRRDPNFPDVQEGAQAQLRAILEAHRWNRHQTAKALGISRTTLWRRMKALGLSS